MNQKWRPTHHSIGPARKATQSGEFRRYIKIMKPDFPKIILVGIPILTEDAIKQRIIDNNIIISQIEKLTKTQNITSIWPSVVKGKTSPVDRKSN